MYGDDPITVLAGRITEVGDYWVMLEGTARIRLGLEIDSERLTMERAFSFARGVSGGEYVAENVVVEQGG